MGGHPGRIREVLGKVADAPARIAAICACGQMHGTVLVDAEGQLTRDTALLWNDKRTLPQVGDVFRRVPDADAAAGHRQRARPRLAGLQARLADGA